MRSVGDILKQERERLRLSYEDVTQRTKIKVLHLKAIEQGNYSLLPPAPFTKGLIKNYAQCLGLNGNEMLALYRREFDEKRVEVEAGPRFSSRSFFTITPAMIVRSFLAIAVIVFSMYFIHEYQILTGPPTLTLTSPAQEQTIVGTVVSVVGKTSPEASVTINGQQIAVEADGSFSDSIDILQQSADPSSQVGQIAVVAVSKNGKSTKIERNVRMKNQ